MPYPGAIIDPSIKPLWGSQVDRDHPLSDGLAGAWIFNEGMSNRVFDPVSNTVGAIFDYTWVGTERGYGLTLGTDTGTANRTALGHPKFTNDFSIVCLAKSISGNGVGMVGAWNTGGTPGTNEYLLGYNPTGNPADNRPFFNLDIASTVYGVTDSNAWSAGVPLFLAGVRQGTSMTLYRADGAAWKGVTASGSCGSGTITYAAGRSLQLGDIDATPTLNTNHTVYHVYLYSTALSADIVQRLHREPYGMFQGSTVRRFYSIPAPDPSPYPVFQVDSGQVARKPIVAVPY